MAKNQLWVKIRKLTKEEITQDIVTCAFKSDSSGKLYATNDASATVPDAVQACVLIKQTCKYLKVTHQRLGRNK